MIDGKKWYVRSEDGKVYGPADVAALVIWAQDGRVGPSSFVSQDRISWMPAQLMPELEMKWLVEMEPGKVFGPFPRAVLIRLSKNGELGETAKFYRLHELAVDQDPPPVIKEVIREVRVEVPVEKVVEKIVEVEKIVKVEPTARTELVVAEVVEPEAAVPPPKAASSIFGGVDRDRLAALEAAARQELASARSGRLAFNLFGGKRK